jgi:hypothetical protein
MDAMNTADLLHRIGAEVSAWPGVGVRSHRFGGSEFSVGRRELGHLHANGLADMPFTKRVRDELIAQGRIVRHHVLPDSGWGTRFIRDEADADAVVELFRMQYQRALEADGAASQDEAEPAADRQKAELRRTAERSEQRGRND